MSGKVVLAGACLALASALGARAQSQGPARIDATTLALHWLAGRFAMPITCERADGTRVDVEESVTIKPAPEQGSSTFKATFFGIDVADARRCYTLVDPELPDRRGVLYFTFRSLGRPDLGTRDFRLQLETGALDYPVQSGSLRIRPLGAPAEAARVVDFAGAAGALEVRMLQPGSDGWRVLSGGRGEPLPAANARRRLEFRVQHAGEPALHGYYQEVARR
jgi:hypothetical protein